MFEQGKACCPKDLEEITRFVYYLAEENAAVEIGVNALGDYQPFWVDQKNKGIRVYRVEKVEKLNGLPFRTKIKVEWEKGRVSTYTLDASKRICPHCYEKREIQYLPLFSGYYDTVVVAVEGAPSVGKTAFVASTNFNIYDVENVQTLEYIANKVKLKATQLGERDGLLSELIITNKRGNPIANLILVDTPGEIFTQSREARGTDWEEHMQRIIKSDGLVHIVDRSTKSVREAEYMMQLNCSVDQKKPVVIVMTKMDQLEKECKDKGGMLMYEDGMPLTTKYFEKKQKMDKLNFHDKAMNMVLDKYVINKLCPATSVLNKRKNTSYCFISSGKPYKNVPDELDITKASCVTMPLEAILASYGYMKIG